KKERETIWIDAKPDITAPAAQVIAEPEPLDEKDIPKVNADGEPYYDIPLSEERQDTVIYFCKEYGVPVELVYGIMWVGSGFDEGLISETGDYGIMQINESNFEQLTNDLGATDYLDFSQNVHCGVHMLAGYYHKYSDFSKTAMCYRYGETSAKRMWEQGVEDTDYTKKLVRALSTIKER
ncbi:MAG: transglycosylase SLT domain-containing protein, partial [Clostridia bacterium]|nr:transglycosylase SLT domain-containing protein [Clostridia bacterium]